MKNLPRIKSYENNPELKKYEKKMLNKLEKEFRKILETMGYDVENDENLIDTPRRMAKMFLELTEGNRAEFPKITFFEKTLENPTNNTIPVYVGPIQLKSLCSHHFLPFTGYAFVGYIPKDGRVLGLSKIPRIVNWLMRRPHLQEKLTQMIVETIVDIAQPLGCIAAIYAKHSCMAIRGANETDGWMYTWYAYGEFQKPELKRNFDDFVHTSIKRLK